MKSEIEVLKKYYQLLEEIKQTKPRSYQRNKLMREFNILHWVLLE